MGFNEERLQIRGRLADAEHKARQMEIRLQALASSIRGALPAFCRSEEIEAAKAAALAVELASLHADYLGLLGEIKAMKNALGL